MLAASAGQNPRAGSPRAQISAALAAATDLVAVLDVTLDSETARKPAPWKLEPSPSIPWWFRSANWPSRPGLQSAERGLEFTVWVDPDLEERTSGAAIADPARTRQILANLPPR